MTHKQNCVGYCMEYLQLKGCAHYFNTVDFNHVYRKFNGANGNAFSIGLGAADYILRTAKPKPDERRNED